MTTNNLNNVPEVFLPSGTIVGDLVQYPGGSSDSIPQLPKINNTPISAAFAILSKQGGLQLPVLTTAQINNLVTDSGMLVYNSNTNLLNFSFGGTWYPIDSTFGPITAPKISLGDGSAAAPSMTFINDATTGLYLEALHVLGITANGALQAAVYGLNTAVNAITFSGAPTGIAPLIGVIGSDALISLSFQSTSGTFEFLSDPTHTYQAAISINNLANTHAVNLLAPAALGASVNYILPGTIVAGGILTTDISGDLTWEIPSNTVMSIQSVYYSNKGNDTAGNGTISYPFATPTKALTYALTLTPTAEFQVNIIGDPGTYEITNGALIYPNINWVSNGGAVIWTTNGMVTTITLNAAGWSGTLSYVNMSGITLDTTLTLTLNTTGITNFNNNFSMYNLNCVQAPVLTCGNSSHTFTMYSYECIFDTTFSTGCVFDGITVFDKDSNFSSANQIIGTVTWLSTHNNFIINSWGASIGSITCIASATHSCNQSYFGSNPTYIQFATNNGGGITILRDYSTWRPTSNITGAITDTNLSELYTDSPVGLADGATVQWNVTEAPTALWSLSANGHVLQTPSNIITSSATYKLIVQNNGFQPSFNASYIFPQGQPLCGTLGAGTYDVFYFISPDGVNLQLVNVFPVTKTVNTSGTLLSNSVNYLDNSSTVTWTLPASPNVGDFVKVRVNNSSGTITVDLNGGQSMVFGSVNPTASVKSTKQGDAMTFEASTAGGSCIWIAIPEMGNWAWV